MSYGKSPGEQLFYEGMKWIVLRSQNVFRVPTEHWIKYHSPAARMWCAQDCPKYELRDGEE